MDERVPPAADAAPAACPPHHWLVEADPEQGDQHWVCRRCGAEQVHPVRRDADPNWRRTQHPLRGPGEPGSP
jgi:hypothetical protein